MCPINGRRRIYEKGEGILNTDVMGPVGSSKTLDFLPSEGKITGKSKRQE